MYAIVDIETTGGFAAANGITEISIHVFDGDKVSEIFETLINPQRSIPPFVTRLTNITWDMVKNAPTFDRVAADVMRVLRGNVFVAHMLE